MTLMELGSAAAVREFLANNHVAVVTFSAHWCGPCKKSKPALEELASKQDKVPMGIVYENDLGEDIIHTYHVRAFPTYILFQQTQEIHRVQGANLAAVQDMIENKALAVSQQQLLTGRGETLGGGSEGAAALSPEQARAARLAKLGGAGATAPDDTTAAAAATTTDTTGSSSPMQEDDKKEEIVKTQEEKPDDVEMKDVEEKPEETAAAADPTANLDKEAIETLTSSMGFSLLRAQKGLLYGNGGTVEGAVEWLMEHQDDDDIDEPIQPSSSTTSGSTTQQTAQSYKCNECGKILSNMANLELHANKTGHSDFEESTERVKPLTAEEKAAKIAEIKQLLKAKRAEREAAEKVDDIDREKERRFMGKEMAKTKEQLEMEQRKREAMLRKKEKEEYKKERERIRAELAKDKAERKSHGGKLTSKLGVEGYNPDSIQYDVDDGTGEEHQKKKVRADASKIDEYIAKVSSYKAGGDGGKCLKVLKIYVGNVVDHPDDSKYQSIKMDNKAFKTKVKPFVGAKRLLLAVGFKPNEAGDALELKDDPDRELLADTKAKLEAALIAYG